ncbi:hypothetical protein PIROE2DRAFT_2170 [Piromyces sp. E2]|nr:hypothetical protein PIROE2DRAFT_2170 [Piromyces sp. E2]|eukprot:OUM69752.1 hypothetical protein PIROE2DRAFT_2170 [Piromyces sp. E2]
MKIPINGDLNNNDLNNSGNNKNNINDNTKNLEIKRVSNKIMINNLPDLCKKENITGEKLSHLMIDKIFDDEEEVLKKIENLNEREDEIKELNMDELNSETEIIENNDNNHEKNNINKNSNINNDNDDINKNIKKINIEIEEKKRGN